MKYNRLEGLREEYDLKSKDVASKLGVGSSAYSDWERNKVRIPTKRLIELADYYKVNIDYLMCLTDKRKTINPKKLDLDIIGIRIKESREELGYNLRKMGEVVDITFSSLSNYENGKTLIQSDILISISKITNYSVDYLLNRSDEKYLK